MPQSTYLSDDFDDFLAEAGQDPIFRSAYEDAQCKHALLDTLVGMRRDQGISQTVLAKRMGVGQSTVSGFETEDSDPRLSTLQRYARAVGGELKLRVKVPSNCYWMTPSSTYQPTDTRLQVGAVRPVSTAAAWPEGAKWRRSA